MCSDTQCAVLCGKVGWQGWQSVATKTEPPALQVRSYAIPGGSEEIMLDLAMKQAWL